jgi:hypothetical protein
MREKMRPVRKNFQQEAWIGIGSGFATRKCRIVNASDTGAKLLLDDLDFLVDRFKLKLTRTSQGRTCKVAWQRGREVGAEFV